MMMKTNYYIKQNESEINDEENKLISIKQSESDQPKKKKK